MIRRILLPVVATLLAIPVLSFAQTPAMQESGRKEDEVRLQLKSDLYVAGGNPRIMENVVGDVNIAGGNVTVSGDVDGNVQAAGGTVIVEGDVRENVRVAGGNVTVEGHIGGNLVVFGGNVRVAPSALIEGDVVMAGGQLVLDGSVRGMVKADGGMLDIGATIDGPVELRVESINLTGRLGADAIIVAREWRLSSDARVDGNLRYWSPGKTLTGLTVGGSTTYDETLMPRKHEAQKAAGFAAFLGVLAFLSLLSAALVIALLLALSRTLFRDTAALLDASPWMSLLMGFLYFVVTPIAIVFLALTLIGLPVAAIVGAQYLIALLVAKPLTAVVFARWIEKKQKAKWSGIAIFFLALGLYVVLKFLMLVPIFGWAAVFLLVCMAFGAVMKAKFVRYLKVR